MDIILNCNLSESRLVIPIEVETVSYHGSIDGYDFDNDKSSCCISFVPKEGTDINELMSKLHSQCYESQRENITLKDTFPEYNKDKRPRIMIVFRNGYRGMSDSPSINFKA